jgi:hypothetical protein
VCSRSVSLRRGDAGQHAEPEGALDRDRARDRVRRDVARLVEASQRQPGLREERGEVGPADAMLEQGRPRFFGDRIRRVGVPREHLHVEQDLGRVPVGEHLAGVVEEASIARGLIARPLEVLETGSQVGQRMTRKGLGRAIASVLHEDGFGPLDALSH